MEKILDKEKLNIKDTYDIIPSKSVCHRALVCAAFSEMPTRILWNKDFMIGEDIEATIGALEELGAEIEKTDYGLFVKPVKRVYVETDDGIDPASGEQVREPEGYHEMEKFKDGHKAIIDCKDSGTTFRFMFEILKELGIEFELFGSARLLERIRSNAPSSQSISGRILALGLKPYGLNLSLSGDIPSRSYVEMTIKTMCDFGCTGYESPEEYEIEGDWTQASYLMALGATKRRIKIRGLNLDSAQGDKQILEILSAFGANVKSSKRVVSVAPGKLVSLPRIDMTNIPDLLPTLAAIASVASGTTTFTNVGRLRYKESDRVLATLEMINNLGGNAKVYENELKVTGGKIKGGMVNTYHDHRIAMAAVILAMVAEENVVIDDYECVNKSFPGFWEQFE